MPAREASLVLLIACLIASGCNTPDEPASFVIDVAQSAPAPGKPVSIRGCGVFVTVRNADGDVIPGSGVLEEPIHMDGLLPGRYEIIGRLAPASDAISCTEVNGQRQCTRSYGPTSAECAADMDLMFAEVALILVTAQGGESGSISRID